MKSKRSSCRPISSCSALQRWVLLLVFLPTAILSFSPMTTTTTHGPPTTALSSRYSNNNGKKKIILAPLRASGTGLDPPDQALLGGIISLFIGLSVYTTVHPEVTDMIRKAFDERMDPIPDGTFERGGKIVTTPSRTKTSSSTEDPTVVDDKELEETVERIHELTEKMSQISEELAQSKTEYFDQRIEMAKNAIYTVPREFREPVAPVDDGIRKRRFWPWRRRRNRRQQ